MATETPIVARSVAKLPTTNTPHQGIAKEEHIQVAVRMRPLNARERSPSGGRAWQVDATKNTVLEIDARGAHAPGAFDYEHTFDETASTREVYEGIGKGVVTSVLRGCHGALIMYGQTSSGKTFTMQGDRKRSDSDGIVHMAASDIFAHVKEKSSDRDFVVSVSFVEVYNEKVKDLSCPPGADAALTVREDKHKRFFVKSHEVVVTSAAGLVKVLLEGGQRRKVGTTKMNEQSSRSHTIFRITVESVDRGCSMSGEVRSSMLNLVDLAGSESVRHTGATGERRREGGSINKSLLALNGVIASLGENARGNAVHVNYRGSNLTKLLQPSLGHAKVAIVCCATPSGTYREETRTTLQFAERAQLVKTRTKISRRRLMDGGVGHPSCRSSVASAAKSSVQRASLKMLSPACRLFKSPRRVRRGKQSQPPPKTDGRHGMRRVGLAAFPVFENGNRDTELDWARTKESTEMIRLDAALRSAEEKLERYRDEIARLQLENADLKGEVRNLVGDKVFLEDEQRLQMAAYAEAAAAFAAEEQKGADSVTHKSGRDFDKESSAASGEALSNMDMCESHMTELNLPVQHTTLSSSADKVDATSTGKNDGHFGDEGSRNMDVRGDANGEFAAVLPTQVPSSASSEMKIEHDSKTLGFGTSAAPRGRSVSDLETTSLDVAAAPSARVSDDSGSEAGAALGGHAGLGGYINDVSGSGTKSGHGGVLKLRGRVDPHSVECGNVGYSFQKEFNDGWFTGTVMAIRPGAKHGKDRRCVYEDGDVEDLSLQELKDLAREEREAKMIMKRKAKAITTKGKSPTTKVDTTNEENQVPNIHKPKRDSTRMQGPATKKKSPAQRSIREKNRKQTTSAFESTKNAGFGQVGYKFRKYFGGNWGSHNGEVSEVLSNGMVRCIYPGNKGYSEILSLDKLPNLPPKGIRTTTTTSKEGVNTIRPTPSWRQQDSSLGRQSKRKSRRIERQGPNKKCWEQLGCDIWVMFEDCSGPTKVPFRHVDYILHEVDTRRKQVMCSWSGLHDCSGGGLEAKWRGFLYAHEWNGTSPLTFGDTSEAPGAWGQE